MQGKVISIFKGRIHSIHLFEIVKTAIFWYGFYHRAISIFPGSMLPVDLVSPALAELIIMLHKFILKTGPRFKFLLRLRYLFTTAVAGIAFWFSGPLWRFLLYIIIYKFFYTTD